MPKSFEVYLSTEIDRIGGREKLSEDKAFLFWFATNVLDLSEDDAREAMSVEGANDKGIDLFWVDDDEGRVIIAQGKYSARLQFHPKIGHVTNLESSLNWLVSPEALRREGKPDLAQAAEDYLNASKDGYGVELWFVYTGPKSANIDRHIAVYNQNPDNLSKRRAFRHYHLDLLRAAWQEFEGDSRKISKESVVIAEGKSLPFDGAFGRALVATVPGSEIVRLYDEYEDRLFDRNVRLFLGVRKGSVNAGIAETLSDGKDCLNFWAYNNGITIICDSFSLHGSKIDLKNFSIVNGCQTAVSLAQGLKATVSNVHVLVRFIAVSAGIVDDVIRFTNSQNPIRTWDIASQDRIQRRLKSEFASLSKPFIYLTRRGARPRGNLKKYREDGKLRQIRIDVIGQFAAAFRGDPVLAYKHKAFIFSRYHDDVFPPDVRVEEVLFQWVCGEAAKAMVQEAMSKKKDEEVHILKKGGTLFVLAVMSKILSLRNGATFLKGAKEHSVSSNTTTKRLQAYAQYARDTYVQAVLDQSGIEDQELPTLIRSREFYNRVLGRIERSYQTTARAAKWLSEALPKLDLGQQVKR
jgi:hypothetical protein